MRPPRWLSALFRDRELPDNATTPVRVDFVGRVVSPNDTTSPITGLTAAMLEIALVDWETILVNQRLMDDRETDRFTTLGAARFGTALVIEDARRRSLFIDPLTALRVVPLSERPLVLDVPPPKELLDVAQKSRHMLSYREVRFREGDAVRVIASVQSGDVVMQAGGAYRDAVMRTLVPAPGERLELREMI
jgi:hypothetical protein